MIRAHPALLMGAGLVCTASIVITYTKIVRPALKRRKSDEAQVYAEYLFQQESKKFSNKSNS
jgi:type II secretory pathway component PulM